MVGTTTGVADATIEGALMGVGIMAATSAGAFCGLGGAAEKLLYLGEGVGIPRIGGLEYTVEGGGRSRTWEMV